MTKQNSQIMMAVGALVALCLVLRFRAEISGVLAKVPLLNKLAGLA